MTPPTTDTSREERFFIRKNGAYYRPNSCGYTTSAIFAGRYTQEEAEKITHPNGPDGPRDGMSYIAEHICPDKDWQEYRAVCAERDALRDQLAAARNEALEDVKRSMMGFSHEHADHWSEEFAQGAETQTIGLIGVVDALKSTTPAPRKDWQDHADRASAIIRGSAEREVSVQEAAVLLLDIWLKEGLEAMQKHLRDLALEETK